MCARCIPLSQPSQFFLQLTERDDKFMDALQSSTRANTPTGVGHLIYTFNQVGVTPIKTKPIQQSQVQSPPESPVQGYGPMAGQLSITCHKT